MKVKKRNGNIVEFDKDKVVESVRKAFVEVDGELTVSARQKSNAIASYIANSETDIIDVEEIQDSVEDLLMASKRKDVARKYIRYRYLHTLSRDSYNDLMDTISEKLSAKNVQNQNANVDELSFGGRVGEASDAVMREFALKYCVSEMAKNNHINNQIYIHDLNSYAVGSHNCYLKSTKFITADGIKKFADFRDGDSVTVLTQDGTWKEAIVHYYGRQPMFEITITRGGVEKTFVATRNHRWILSDGSVTDNLQIGDCLYPLQKMDDIIIDTKRKAEMFSLGFVLGDGYDHNNNIEVKFCTAEKESYLDFFDMAGYHIGTSNGFKYAWKKAVVSKQDFLNNKMWYVLSFEDKRCLFEGYLAADGSKTTNTKYVWTSDDRICSMIEDISALDGYHIFKKKIQNRDTNYKENRVLYQYVLTTSYSNNTAWKVINIAKGNHGNKDYEAWCVEEPETHTFTLDGGIVTGNCLSIPFDDLLKNGFNTRQTDVRSAQSINTAFQLVAVIFQLQSLNQFG